MDRRDRIGHGGHPASTRHNSRALLIAAIAFIASLAGLAGQASAAATAVTPAPSLVDGSYWCGHFDHIAGGGTQPLHSCPIPTSSPVTLVTDAPNGPFSSGQYIDIAVGPNSTLKPGKRVYIKECAAPEGILPRSPRQCDRRTVQQSKVFVGPHGTVSYQGYPILALPDATLLGEKTRHTPVCDLTHACVLSVSQDRFDFDQPHVWSLPFFVNPTPGDTGANPGNGLPEVPSVLALPLLAAGIFGGTMLVRRRRASNRVSGHLHSIRH
jgi:hypothetical protein